MNKMTDYEATFFAMAVVSANIYFAASDFSAMGFIWLAFAAAIYLARGTKSHNAHVEVRNDLS